MKGKPTIGYDARSLRRLWGLYLGELVRELRTSPLCASPESLLCLQQCRDSQHTSQGPGISGTRTYIVNKGILRILFQEAQIVETEFICFSLPQLLPFCFHLFFGWFDSWLGLNCPNQVSGHLPVINYLEPSSSLDSFLFLHLFK